MDFSLDFSGLADIARDLETLSRAENNKVLRDATRAGAEVMRDAVVERAPERTGKLKEKCGCSHSAFKASGGNYLGCPHSRTEPANRKQ